jgi:hypothetical protein
LKREAASFVMAGGVAAPIQQLLPEAEQAVYREGRRRHRAQDAAEVERAKRRGVRWPHDVTVS